MLPRSIARRTRTDGADVRVHVAGSAIVVVPRGVGVGVGGDIEGHIGTAVRGVALDTVASRIRAGAKNFGSAL